MNYLPLAVPFWIVERASTQSLLVYFASLQSRSVRFPSTVQKGIESSLEFVASTELTKLLDSSASYNLHSNDSNFYSIISIVQGALGFVSIWQRYLKHFYPKGSFEIIDMKGLG